MVSSDKSSDRNVSPDKSHQKLSSHSEINMSKETNENKIDSSEPVEARNVPSVVAEKEVEDSDATVDALQSDKEGSACSSPLEKPLQSPSTTRHALQSRQDSPTIIHEKVLKDVAKKEIQDSDATADALQSDKERSPCSLPHEKPSQKPNSVLHALQSVQDSPSIIREKVSKDGYNWRKYGQKHVKGNEFIRSYYKCTHPNCQAKKQLEQSNNGQITDTIYIGQHNHPQVNTPVPIDSVMTVVKEKPDKPSSVSMEDKASIEHGCESQQVKLKPLEDLPISTISTKNEVKAALVQSTRTRDVVPTNEDPESKRLKKNNSNADVTGIEKSASESRVVVQTSSEVDFINDGYRWRKYGQKLVKGNPNPRSYYRCSIPGCPVKKHVERASHDQKIVITTYEGHHDHENPSGRIVTHNEAANTPTTNINSDSVTKSRGNTPCVQTVESTCFDSERKSTEQSNNENISKSKSCDMVKSTSNEKEQNGNSHTEKDSVNIDTICHSGSELPCRLNEQKKDEYVVNSSNFNSCFSTAECISVVYFIEISTMSCRNEVLWIELWL
ncbi:WRKY transcription factor 1-like [Senna tora]|uniref:WRKY transcription factor 1-like n=1 Tax=Senna tora TaxID=362788 RepID=A0A834WL63_9FABA|nr:WRKY transcription factor 1-like [Senna tora]